jgi:hypothetical protein
MKKLFLLSASGILVLLLGACGQTDRFASLEKVIDQQNKTIIDQQQAVLDDQQKLTDQEIHLASLTQQVAYDEQVLKKLQDDLAGEAPAKVTDPALDAHKQQVFRLLAGFNARLSANIGYGAYSDGLSDLNSNLMQGLIEVKDQSFIDEVNRILCLYNYAGEFWQRFASDGSSEINLSAADRYKYSSIGITFIDSYQPRQTDVKKFWTQAGQELQKLVDFNRDALGQGDSTIRLFAR